MAKNKRKNRREKVKYLSSTTTTQGIGPNKADEFEVIIPTLIYEQCMYWVNKTNYEVSWFGTVVFDEENRKFIVTKAVFLKQEGHATETEIDAEALAKAMYELKDEPGEIRWWGHSHVNMQCYWSQTDMSTIRELGRRGWILATVMNKRREMRSAYLQPVSIMDKPHDFFVDQIPTKVLTVLPKEMTDEWDKDFQEKFRPASSTFYAKGTYGSYGNIRWINGVWHKWCYKKRDWVPEEDEVNGNTKEIQPIAHDIEEEEEILPNTRINVEDLWRKFSANTAFMEMLDIFEKGEEEGVDFTNVFSLPEDATEEDFLKAASLDEHNFQIDQENSLVQDAEGLAYAYGVEI